MGERTGRPNEGYATWRGGRWQTRVTDKATGKRIFVDLDKKDTPPEQRLKQTQEGIARKYALALQNAYERTGRIPGDRQITVNEFFRLWSDWRRARYPNQVVTDEQAFKLWISPELGTMPMKTVSRELLIAFSNWLDKKAAEGEDFREKRARNIFSVVAAMFRDAHEAKDPGIRILDKNPCADVPWPEKPAGDPIHQLLYPREFVALLECPDTPIVRARLYAFALYMTARIGEIRVLECPDIDVDNLMVRIVKAADRHAKEPTKKDPRRKAGTKLTKSGRSRIATLEETLAPLIDTMVEERDGKGRFFPSRPLDMPKGNQHDRKPVEYIHATSKVCEVFRRDLRRALKWAGIKERPELFDDSDPAASQPIRFHDLRASGITWRHARGDNPAIIRQECGHEDAITNEIYIRALRGLAVTDLFPELPARLYGAESLDQGLDQGSNPSPFSAGIECRRRESKTRFPPRGRLRIAPSRSERGPPIGSGRSKLATSGNRSTPVDTVAADLAIALKAAAAAGRWEIVSELSRQLAELHRGTSGQMLPVLEAKHS